MGHGQIADRDHGSLWDAVFSDLLHEPLGILGPSVRPPTVPEVDAGCWLAASGPHIQGVTKANRSPSWGASR